LVPISCLDVALQVDETSGLPLVISFAEDSKMNETSGLRVSFDVGCYQHSVAIGLADGILPDEFELSHDPVGFDRLFERIERLCERRGNMVSVAMEGYNGCERPLETLACAHGCRLYNISNLQLARFKAIFPAAARTDRIDARRGLGLFQLRERIPTARGVLQEVQGVPLENEKLKRLTRRRKGCWWRSEAAS